MKNQTNVNNKIINTDDNHEMPQEKPKKRNKLKVAIRILIPLFGLAIIFYSFLGWKMTRTSNPLVANPKFIFKSIFTWNPAELAFNVFNKWDTLYLTDTKIKPVENFLDLKKQLEKVTGNKIYFTGLLNSIAIDDNENYVNNKGSYIMEKNNKYYIYDYYIYKSEVKATKSYELNHKVGLTIYKQPQNVKNDTIEEYKNFTSAILKALSNINFKELITKKTKQISLSRFMEMNIIQTSNDLMKPVITITFDNEGEIIEDSRNKTATKKETINQSINSNSQKTQTNNIPTKQMSNDTLDLDNDGLTGAEEKKYGTNPNIRDTDGDGYTDGEEVKNGYNPLK